MATSSICLSVALLTQDQVVCRSRHQACGAHDDIYPIGLQGGGHAQVGLLDRLLKIVPPSLTRFFFANSGSEAVDNAIKVARAHTKRQNIICFEVHILYPGTDLAPPVREVCASA